MRTILRRWLSAANPFQPVGTMPLDRLDTTSPLDRCMVLACGEDWTDDTHGWRTCTTHAPRVVVLSS